MHFQGIDFSNIALPIIDGNWIDIMSILSGILYILYKRNHQNGLSGKKKYKLISRKTGIDFSNGVALFPLLVLPLASISSEVMTSLSGASKVTIAMAGVFGVLAILEE